MTDGTCVEVSVASLTIAHLDKVGCGLHGGVRMPRIDRLGIAFLYVLLTSMLSQQVAEVYSLYRSRTRHRYCDLWFGWMSWLRQDRDSWLFVWPT